MQPIDVIKRARAIVIDENQWTRNSLAVDKVGSVVRPTAPEAVKWCVMGACIKVLGTSKPSLFDPVLKELRADAPKKYGFSISMLNDRGGHDELIRVLDKTIARLEKNDA
jgi:hypothetical protein